MSTLTRARESGTLTSSTVPARRGGGDSRTHSRGLTPRRFRLSMMTACGLLGLTGLAAVAVTAGALPVAHARAAAHSAVAHARAVAEPAVSAQLPARPQPSAAFNSAVYAVAYHDDVVYVGGRFTTARADGKSVSRSRAAAVDAASGELLRWAPRADGAVRAIAVAGDSVYLGGDFTHVNGQRRHGLAKLDADTGALDSEFAPAVNGRVLALAAAHDRLYVGGSFSEVSGRARGNLAAVALGDGAVDRGWRPEVDRAVRTIAAGKSRIYLAGVFSRLNGSRDHRKLAAVDPETGGVDSRFRPGAQSVVRDVVVFSGGVYAATGGRGGQLTAYDRSGAVSWTATANGDFQAVAVLDDVVYAGGHFTTVCRTAGAAPGGASCQGDVADRHKLAAFSLTGELLSWAPQANSDAGVHAMAASPERDALAVGGEFTTLDSGAIQQSHFAQFR